MLLFFFKVQIGHMALPGSGSEESSDRTSARAKVLTISPIFLETIYSNPTTDNDNLKLLIVSYVFMMG